MAVDRAQAQAALAALQNAAATPEARKAAAQAALAQGKSFLQKPLPTFLNSRLALILVFLGATLFGGFILETVFALVIFVAVVVAAVAVVYFLKKNQQS